VNCERARLLIGAEPYATSPELAEHLASCAACKQFQGEMVSLENDLRRALEGLPGTAVASATDGVAGARPTEATAPTPTAAASPTNVTPFRAPQPTPAPAQAPARRRALQRSGWAVAASVLALTTLSIWIFRPTNTLAHEVVLHVNHEAASWNSSTPVDARDLQNILGKSGVTLKVTSSDVTYARTCYFRGHFVPHLVMSTTEGPVTLLALPDEHVPARESFQEGGYSGVIVPAEHGSIAVLAREGANIDAVASNLAH
jgi:Protein of unknown function (DUF3379)